MAMLGNFEKDQTFTLASGESITGDQVVFMNASPSSPDDLEVKVFGTGTEIPVGLSQYDDAAHPLAAGDQVTVRVWGVTRARAAGAINPGQPVYGAANGLVTATTPATTHWSIGFALTQASALGDEILILISRHLKEA